MAAGRANAAGCVPRCRWAASAERAAARGRRAPHDHAGCSLQSSPPAAPRASRRRPAAAGGRHQRSQQHPVQLPRLPEPSEARGCRAAVGERSAGKLLQRRYRWHSNLRAFAPLSRREGGRGFGCPARRPSWPPHRTVAKTPRQWPAARVRAVAVEGTRPPPAAARAPQPGRETSGMDAGRG